MDHEKDNLLEAMGVSRERFGELQESLYKIFQDNKKFSEMIEKMSEIEGLSPAELVFVGYMFCKIEIELTKAIEFSKKTVEDLLAEVKDEH